MHGGAVVSHRRIVPGDKVWAETTAPVRRLVHLLVVVEAGPLGEGLVAKGTLVRLVASVHPAVRLQSRRLPKHKNKSLPV